MCLLNVSLQMTDVYFHSYFSIISVFLPGIVSTDVLVLRYIVAQRLLGL